MLENRMSWLARPWFFAAVAVLALNDHVFKQAFPGWVTGKLSDVAGLVVVATVFSVLLGPGGGGALAGVAFLALKIVPGVAEAVAPLMGGTPTLRDASDLLALVALPPLWLALRRDRPGRLARTRRGWAMLGLIAAVAATTATSPAPRSEVRDVGYLAGAFHAEVYLEDGYGTRSLRSTDGGATWSREEQGPGIVPHADELGDKEGWQLCSGSVCYRVIPVHASGSPGSLPTWWVQRRDAEGEWQVEKYLGTGGFGVSGLAVNPSNTDQAMIGNRNTVLVRVATGVWREVDLVAAASDPKWQRDLVSTLGSPGFTFVICLLTSVIGWLLVPWLAVRWVLQAANVLAFGVMWVFGILSSPVGRLRMDGIWFAIVVVLTLLMRLTWWLDRRSRPPARDAPGGGRP